MAPRVLLWTARITGTLLLAFLLFMLIGHLLGDANGPEGMRFNGGKEIMSFILFPVCSIIGLALAYKRELLGGLIAVLSMVLLFVMRPDLLMSSFVLVMLPGALYVIHSLMARKTVTR
ncbi:MAG TPA: hypothetical protein PKY96_10935 [Flavobacteriales bacterium]|nr:hypothetical protein [Flavobacteriales bacterium]